MLLPSGSLPESVIVFAASSSFDVLWAVATGARLKRTSVDAFARLSARSASFSALLISALLVRTAPYGRSDAIVAMNDTEPLVPTSKSPRSQTIVRPSALTEQAGATQPLVYVTPLGSVSVSWMPVAGLVAVNLL